MPAGSGDGLERAFRDEWAGVVASLARRLGDLQLAEDAAQDAFLAAAARWPRDGVPPNPAAWLMLTARRNAIDRLRSSRQRSTTALAWQTLREQQAADEQAAERLSADEGAGEGADVPDDRLRLIFTCCHPAISLEARVALTLRLVAGLTTPQIASAFLVPEATMAQRLVRAKAKLRQAGAPFELPSTADLPARLDGVLAVLYLVFNEGYAATGDGALVRADLCDEAIRLCRLLGALMSDDAEAAGLLALMLLHRARQSARTDSGGRPVPLVEQDRLRWAGDGISEGLRILDDALRRGRAGPFQVQAAIAALHAQAPTFEETDWPQIAALYGELARRSPSPVVDVNRAVAVGMADGPRAGLAILAGVLARGELEDYAPLHAAHADLLERSGDRESARAAWARAARASRNPVQRDELLRRSYGTGPGAGGAA